MTRFARLVFLAIVALAPACANPPAARDPVLAEYRGGAVTQSALDELLRSLPPTLRRPEDGDFDSWHARLLEDLATRDILLELAHTDGLAEDPAMRARLGDLEREVAVESYLAHAAPTLEPPAEAEVAAAYERWREEFSSPERRQIHHLFRRAEPDLAGEAEAEMEALRARVRAGEPLSRLARELSDSETRHRDGLMGWFSPGELDPRLERIVFALPARTVSEPIRTGTGVHLFWVEEIQPAAEPTLETVRPQVVERLRRERGRERAESLVAIEPPPGSFLPDDEQLRVLLSSGDADAVLLRIGAYELRLEDLRGLLARAAASGEPPPNPADAVRAIRTRELLYLQWQEGGGELDAEAGDRLERLRRTALASEYARRRLLEQIAADRQRLETFYERNRLRYSEPLRLLLERAVFPFGTEPNRTMARLEAAGAALDGGEQTLEALARELGGRLEDLGWKSLAELQREAPGLAGRVSDLPAGRHSAPLRRGEAIEIARVVERRGPRPLPLARIESQVEEDLLAAEGQELYAELAQRLRAERGFRVVAAPAGAPLVP